MSIATAPIRRRRWRVIAILLAMMLAGTGLALWYMRDRIDESGERISFVWFGQPATASFGGKLPPAAVSADLAAAGAHAEGIQITGSGEGILFVSRQRTSLLMWMTAGNEPLETARLGYVLFAASGEEIGHGILQPPVRIEASKSVSTEVVHARVTEAARIEIQKLP